MTKEIPGSKKHEPIGEEYLSKANLIKYFMHTHYLDVLPYYFPLKSI